MGKRGVLLDRDYNYSLEKTSPVIPFEDRCLEPPKAPRAKTPQEVCLGVAISHKVYWKTRVYGIISVPIPSMYGICLPTFTIQINQM